ncbi:abortive infection family protein [Spirosoma aerophilum]
MLSAQEIYTITEGYIGVENGYLGSFTYKTHTDFYPQFCDLEINPNIYEGTTRVRFIKILKESDGLTQGKILKGILKKFPVSYFGVEQKEFKSKIANRITEIIQRLESGQSIVAEQLAITNQTVERAIQDAKVLIENNGATSGVDRIHTALHGYLKQVCVQSSIPISEDDSLTQLFSKLRVTHPLLQNLGVRENEIDKIIKAFSNVLDKLNPIRNKSSLSHPNEQLLEEDEAMFVINAAQTVFNYLNRKFK